MLCAVFSLCYVPDLLCLMCGFQLVLWVVFSLCYLQSLVRVMRSLQSVLCEAFSIKLAAKAYRRFARAQGAHKGQFHKGKTMHCMKVPMDQAC